MTSPEERLQQMLAKLKDQGLRITPQRLAVLKVLASSDGHPAVEQIHQRILSDFPTTGLSTVYKIVNLLKEQGEVLELSFADTGNRYDGNKPYPHPHVICTRCGRIADPECVSMDSIAHEMAAQTGFQISSHLLTFFGLCPDCQ